MAETFGERLVVRARERGPLCVGIDPSVEALAGFERGNDITGLEFFMLRMLEAVSDVAVAIKPQVAYFERFGSSGFRALERLLAEARDAEMLVVADAKRGDIGSTNDGYAQAWLEDRSPLSADALTLSPYLGMGAMSSLFETAQRNERGLFVVVASSNEEGRPVQTARTSTGESVEDFHLRQLAEINERCGASVGFAGAVVGATRSASQFALEDVRGPFLVPGVGAQGATASDVGRLFGRCVKGSVLVNSSRGISAAGPERRALSDAARRLRDDLIAALF